MITIKHHKSQSNKQWLSGDSCKTVSGGQATQQGVGRSVEWRFFDDGHYDGQVTKECKNTGWNVDSGQEGLIDVSSRVISYRNSKPLRNSTSSVAFFLAHFVPVRIIYIFFETKCFNWKTKVSSWYIQFIVYYFKELRQSGDAGNKLKRFIGNTIFFFSFVFFFLINFHSILQHFQSDTLSYIDYYAHYYTHFEITGDPCNLIGSQKLHHFLLSIVSFL